jgi:hypothetical protein
MHTELLIAVASWEPRFVLGFERLVEDVRPSRMLMYYLREFATWTADARERVSHIARSHGVELDPRELSFENPAASWRAMYETLSGSAAEGCNVTLDMTTAPREVIWTVLDILSDRVKEVQFVYHQPTGYNPEWLTRDPGKPRLVYKLGGLARLGLPTELLVLTGYDTDRVKQLIAFFEPARVMVGLQTGSQFDNQERNVGRSRRALAKEEARASFFQVNAYGEDRGYEAIETEILPRLEDANVIMSSLGPKPSALALFELHRRHPETALVYAPSKEFNREYSYGIDRTVYGMLSLHHVGPEGILENGQPL